MRIAYFVQVKEVGHSLMIRIPKDVKTIGEIEIGDYVRVEVEKVH